MTRMFVLRHGATGPNLENPPRLQGRGLDEALAPAGIAQLQHTRDALAALPVVAVYSSPLRRARESAAILAEGFNLSVHIEEGLQEGDVGRWEGRSWEQIKREEPEAYRRFMEDPGTHGYAGGETFNDVARRVVPVFDGILQQHPRQCVVVVSHQIVCRVYLAGLLGLSPSLARRVKLENGGISEVRLEDGKPIVWTLNSALHLQ